MNKIKVYNMAFDAIFFKKNKKSRGIVC